MSPCHKKDSLPRISGGSRQPGSTPVMSRQLVGNALVAVDAGTLATICTATKNILFDHLVGSSEEQISFHEAFAFDVNVAVRHKPKAFLEVSMGRR